jgi:hypothetical protein
MTTHYPQMEVAPADPAPTPTLCGLLPLRVGGRHYADNLARTDLLLSSLHHFAPGLLDELLVVVRADEQAAISRYLQQWQELPLRMVVEDDVLPEFRQFTKPWQVRPWQRQQIIKLAAPEFASADFFLTLDPDVMAVRTVDRPHLFVGRRALIDPQPKELHRQWWLDSGRVLQLVPDFRAPGMHVTPALLSSSVLRRLHRRIEQVNGHRWVEALLRSYSGWTEYTLYLLTAEATGLLPQVHIWADDPGAPASLQVHHSLSIWEAAEASRTHVAAAFTTADRGRFVVIQSNSRLPAVEVQAAAAPYLPVRTVAPAPLAAPDRSRKAGELFAAASRRIAQSLYRWRHR